MQPQPLLSDLSQSLSETLAAASAVPLFASLIGGLNPVLQAIQQSQPDVGTLGAVESLGPEIRRARAVVRGCGASAVRARLLEDAARGVGRGLGRVIEAWAEAPAEMRAEMERLRKEMLDVRFGDQLKGKQGEIVADADDLMVRIKNGDEDELGVVLSEIGILMEEGFLVVGEGGSLIPALLNRLGSANCGNRVKIISALRSLAARGNDNKEKMASVDALSIIVRSLARCTEERREAVGLLLDISDILKVRQRIGRIKGSILMLVALQNGDDPRAKDDAGKLLHALSANTQNVLLMAEAGCFVPMMHHLREGSDMNKILMATAISRMLLTEQMKAVLGEGSIEPLVKMFTYGKLEAKQAALGAIRNLSTLAENTELLINCDVISPLFQVLFSVTSVLMTLREPAAALLSTLAKSELILHHRNVAQQILSLLNLLNPAIQLHLLHALNSIVSHSTAKRVRAKLRENGVMQLLQPFLTESNSEIRAVSLNLIFNLSKDSTQELTQQLGESNVNILIRIIFSSTSESEKAAAIGILSNLPVKDKRATEFLNKANLLPLVISLLGTSISSSSTPPTRKWLLENISGLLIRFTIPWDKKLQSTAVSQGVIGCLRKLLSDGSIIAKSRAATSLAQLSQNSLTLCKAKSPKWLCVSPSSETYCEVHNGHCTVKSTFCLCKAGIVSPLIQVLEGKEREADIEVLEALGTLMQDEMWERGSKVIEKASGVPALLRVLEEGNLKAQEKAIWMLERIFRLEIYREMYAGASQALLIDLTQRGDPILRPMIAKILAHLQLLQMQSSYFSDVLILS
ncbi:U-box domain-containing protein 44-like [Ananas comosus]|uniref:U-box domain-containing protein 44-like n=1 Tax=Ananas comosus TaxID=4615 RepID=A0A6P5F2Q4_ANACO|nr:U-box domain-containing protein 44-like [Ananas comosus]